MGVISHNYWTKSWTLSSSVPFNGLKCNHFDLCQNRSEDLGFDPPSPRRNSREFDGKFFWGQFASRPVLQQFWGWPPEKPFSKEVSHAMSTRWTPEPPVLSAVTGPFWGAENSINLTRMDGMGWALFFGSPKWTSSSNLSLSEKVSNDKQTIAVWDQVQISLQESS